MAGNQSRVVELQIKLQGVQSLQELEDITADINSELKNVAINSEEFSQLGDMAKKANSRVKEIGQSLEGVTSTEKSEAINKMGMALLSVFQGAAGASLLFGEQTSEAMNKTIKAVGGLFAITDSVKKITEAFSAKNISALKSVWKGWMEAAAGAKIFGVSVKTALISTGIGALVVALGLIVANFDKIKNLVGGTAAKEAKAAEEEKKRAEAIKNQFDARVKANQQITEAIKERQKYEENAVELSRQELENAQAILDEATARRAELQEEAKMIIANRKKMFGYSAAERLEAERRLDVVNEELRALGNTLEENKELVKQGKFAKEGEITKLDIIRKQKLWYQEVAKVLFDNNKLIEESQISLIKINALEYNKRKLYEENWKILDNQLKNINKQLEYDELNTVELQKQKKELLAQIDALNTAETIRQRETTLAIKNLKAEAEYNGTINQRIALVNDLIKKYEIIADANESQLKDAERRTAMAETENEIYASLAESHNEIVNFDKKGQEIFAKYFQDYQELYQLEADRIGIGESFNKLNEKDKRIYGEQLLAAKEIRAVKSKEYTTALANNEALLNNLNQQIEANKKVAETAQGRIDNLVTEKLKIEDKLKTAKKGDEEELSLLQKIKDINGEIASVIDIRTTAQDEITGAELKQNQILESNKDIQAEIGRTIKENDFLEKKVTKDIENQVRLTSKLKKFTEDYNSEIQVTRELLGATFELLAAQDDARAEALQRDIDAEKARMEIEQKRIDARNKAEEESADRVDELRGLLADAEGERYQDILDEIAAQDTAKEAAYRAEIDRQNAAGLADWTKNKTLMDLENQKAQYEYQAAKHRKTAAIIDATIQTALAVIKALPNVFLAAATGVLGAVGIATIAAQKLPPKPEAGVVPPYVPIPYKKGGYTGDGDVNQPAGIVHAGEYVVPQYVMRNPRAIPMVETLEGMRKRGYAEGGIVASPPSIAAATQNAIDYKMIGSEVANALRENPIYTSWVEWRDINAKMQFVQSRASLGRR